MSGMNPLINNNKAKKETSYFWGRYKNKAKGFLLLSKEPDGDYYEFAWDVPLSEEALNRLSELIPAVLITPEGEIY